MVARARARARERERERERESYGEAILHADQCIHLYYSYMTCSVNT